MEDALAEAAEVNVAGVGSAIRVEFLTLDDFNAALVEQKVNGAPGGQQLGKPPEDTPYVPEDHPFVRVGCLFDSPLANVLDVLEASGATKREPTSKSSRSTRSWFMAKDLGDDRHGIVVYGTQAVNQVRVRLGHTLYNLDTRALVPPGAGVMTFQFEEGELTGSACGTLRKETEEGSDDATDDETDDDGEGSTKSPPPVYMIDFAVGEEHPWRTDQMLACFYTHAVANDINEPVCRARATDELKARGFKPTERTLDDGEALVECEVKKHRYAPIFYNSSVRRWTRVKRWPFPSDPLR